MLGLFGGGGDAPRVSELLVSAKGYEFTLVGDAATKYFVRPLSAGGFGPSPELINALIAAGVARRLAASPRVVRAVSRRGRPAVVLISSRRGLPRPPGGPRRRRRAVCLFRADGRRNELRTLDLARSLSLSLAHPLSPRQPFRAVALARRPNIGMLISLVYIVFLGMIMRQQLSSQSAGKVCV